MAKYLVLLYEDEAAWANAGELGAQMIKEHGAFREANKNAVVGGHALQSTETATSIRKDDSGHFTVTDAPFAEAKEALGGFYLIEAPDLDAAIAIATQVPAPFGGVEVRPIRVFD
jgi:hypothetical protein